MRTQVATKHKRGSMSAGTASHPDTPRRSSRCQSRSVNSPRKSVCPSPMAKVSRKNLFRIPASYELVFVNQDQQDKYDVLASRKVIPTRYVDESTLSELGLLDDVNYMFDRLGWKEFVTRKCPTYECLTLEFLSSFQISGEIGGKRYIKFRIFNNDHELDLSKFNGLFGLPDEGAFRVGKFHTSNFWHQLTGHPFRPDTGRSSFMSNPCIRYVHRLLSNIVFGRGDSGGVVRSSEVFFLWAMLTAHKVNTGAFIAGQLKRVSNQKDGMIVVGGLIANIALGLGYNLSVLKHTNGPSRIDMESCLAWELVVYTEGQYCLILPHSDVAIPLPAVERTSVKDQRNWQILASSLPVEIMRTWTRMPSSPYGPEPDCDRHDMSSLFNYVVAIMAEQKRQGLVLARVEGILKDIQQQLSMAS